MVTATYLTGQSAVLATTIVTFILSVALAILLTRKYIRSKDRSHLFWSLGLWFFAIGVLLEIVFALNVYSQLLIAMYLLITVVLVELLALGSMELTKTKWLKQAYAAYAVLATLYTAYTLWATNIGNVIIAYVVAGNIPLPIIISSSFATFAATIVLIVVAGKAYLRTKGKKMLSIIAGVVIVAIAGTIYLVQYPAFLYVAEFVGILLLWLGFI
jgi:hypothetical protein